MHNGSKPLVEALFLAPRKPYMGNLVWRKNDFPERKTEISSSLSQLRDMGYWASAFPEGDGIIFTENTGSKSNEEIFADLSVCCDWVKIQYAESNDSNDELAKLVEDTDILKCIVIVPLDKIFIEKTFFLGDFIFCSRKQFDVEPDERLGSYDSEYLQFETFLPYKDLLKINKSFPHNGYVIEKCLSKAEQAMDIIRFHYCSFKRREFTPNPAGQLQSGSFSIEIIPLGNTHLKPVILNEISRPLSFFNNWLGPEVRGFASIVIDLLTAIHRGRSDELSVAVTFALRSCRQSFYSLGSESQFLNLVFALDGLVNPGDWKSWKHRTYIAALLSRGGSEQFGEMLVRYAHLYTNVRNRLVHEGMDFYQLEDDPDDACQTIYQYIKDIIILIAEEGFASRTAMHIYAQSLLQSQSFKQKYIKVIDDVSAVQGKSAQYPQW